MIRYRRPKQDDPVIIRLIETELVPLSHLPKDELMKIKKDLPKRLSGGVTLVASKQYESGAIGFVHFMLHGDLLYIDLMAVTPAEQGKRHGKMLMAHAENFACSRGCIRAKVMVDAGNEQGHSFYKKMGYYTVRFIPQTQCFELEKMLFHRKAVY
ncbi:GNAT family N-acetyltransferase [Paenibacillus sediminis]|uniref:GNAT superfamily N-acetyltransferase n=1 Tax=Paenibacillus sediminis TaxID=664909 RepID=A0ABS4H4N2_9BACL|nr:GNAT family N-acetyltransferase [Paenibacillus sediminis]MBP1937499.1 GNAT superfamily N-acetyltransferase [Paenibacillus sediminis]